MSTPRIGELLVAAELLTSEQLAQALTAQEGTGQRLGKILVGEGLVTEIQVTQVLSNQLSVAWVSLRHVEIGPELLSLIPVELAREHTLLPVHFRKGKKGQKILYVAMDDPTNIPAMQRVSELANMNVRPLIAPPTEIAQAIEEVYGES